MADLHINWRGPLSSCNYDCGYCPFAKHVSSREELAADAEALARFVTWCGDHDTHGRRLSILFTPWGEGLIRKPYQRALITLSHMPWIEAVAIQTNLSIDPALLAEADRRSLGLWTTFHPDQVALEAFLQKCAGLDALGLRYSVGVVGLREHFPQIEALRARLDPKVYLWINAYKSAGPDYYRAEERAWLEGIDPLFAHNAVRHDSLGLACGAGEDSIFVDGRGDVRRCHFVGDVLGNLYDDGLETMLGPRPCPASRCGCFIG
ncbi:MAG: STM4011 family radical SAM protein, partial [Myxococcales bacterium]|nr:STM4011 family radical SAM protein [Myxococcales bacterium]